MIVARLSSVVLTILVLSLLAGLVYLWVVKIPELNESLAQLSSKLENEKAENATLVEAERVRNTALLEAEKSKNTALEANISKTNKQFEQVNQQVSENTKDIACKKAADAQPLPSGLPAIHNYDNGISPKGYSIKIYVDFYKEQVQNDVISKNLPSDAEVGSWWVKPDRKTKAKASEVLAGLKYIEDQYNEYLSNVKICGK